MSNTQNNVHDAASSMALQEVKLIDTLLRVVKVPDVVAQLIAAKGEVSRISSALDLADEDGKFFLFVGLMDLSLEVKRIAVEFIASGIDAMNPEFPGA